MKKIIFYVLAFMGLLMVTYILLIIDTNGIFNEAKEVMLGNVDSSVTINTPLNRYNMRSSFPSAIMNARVTRLFTIHNFTDGYIWVVYSYEGRDEAGELLTGARDTISRWKIHKENGKWEIVDIKEAP